MKVEIHKIDPADEEYAAPHTNRQDASLDQLKNYIESEDYQTVILTADKDGASCKIQSTNICYIESIREIQYICTLEDVYQSRERLYIFLQTLPRWFVRASKSTIINLKQVRKYTPLSGGLMTAEFPGGATAYISRKYVREIRNIMKEEFE